MKLRLSAVGAVNGQFRLCGVRNYCFSTYLTILLFYYLTGIILSTNKCRAISIILPLAHRTKEIHLAIDHVFANQNCIECKTIIYSVYIRNLQLPNEKSIYRYESGNSVKSILGTSNLCWNTDQKEGAYKGQKIYDHNKAGLSDCERYDPKFEAQDMKSRINSSLQRSALNNISTVSKFARQESDYRDDEDSK